MEQITRGGIVRVGVDLAKQVIQVHAVDARGGVVTARAIKRDRFEAWCAQLTARVGWQKAVVALANKNARILWAVLGRGERFDPNHQSVRPTVPAMATAMATAMAG